MIDAAIRRQLAPALDRVAARLHQLGVRAQTVTLTGLAAGVGAAVAASLGWWMGALGLWLANRVLDGLDGAVARREGATALGGFLDIVTDFTVYAAFVVGVAINRPETRLAATVLLSVYYVSGAVFLAWASLAGRASSRSSLGVGEIDDSRSLRFIGGLAEGFETVVVYVAVCLAPRWAVGLLWGFAVLVALTAMQRVRFAVLALRA